MQRMYTSSDMYSRMHCHVTATVLGALCVHHEGQFQPTCLPVYSLVTCLPLVTICIARHIDTPPTPPTTATTSTNPKLMASKLCTCTPVLMLHSAREGAIRAKLPATTNRLPPYKRVLPET